MDGQIIGYDNKADSYSNANVFGNKNTLNMNAKYSPVDEDLSLIIGNYNTLSGKRAVSIGSRTANTHDDAVVIGNHSASDRAGSVSFGSESLKRQLTHVAAGTQDTDAVNVKQLNDKAKDVSDSAKSYTDTQAQETLKSAGRYTDNQLTENNKVINKTIDNAKNEAIQKGREAADNAVKTAHTYTDSKITENNVVINQAIDKAKSDAIETSQHYTDSTISKNNIHINQSISNAKSEAVTTSHHYTDTAITKEQQDRDAAIKSEEQARIKGDRDTLSSANNYTDHRINSLELNGGESLSRFKQEAGQRFRQLDNKIDRVEKRANAGIAGVTAISSIPYVNTEQFSFGMALGHYRDAQAVATGIQYKPSPNTNVRVNASWNNGGDTNVGAGFAVGW